MSRLHVVGLSAFYHESACCLLSDGVLVAAAQEERFSRVKHDPRPPVEAFRFCLEAGGIGPGDLAAVAYYEEPVTKLSRQIRAYLEGRRQAGGSDGSTADPTAAGPSNASDLPWLDPLAPELTIRERLAWDGPILAYRHHLSHAASAYLYSGFPDAAILTVDGVGEWDTTAFGRGAGGRIEILETVPFPHSLGLFYSALTAYLGFRVNGGEYKVMGLAPYGRPRYAERLRRVLRNGPGGQYTLDLAYFDFLGGRHMVSDALCGLLEGPTRRPGDEIEPRHMDVARSAQAVLEEVLLDEVRHLHALVGGDSLCMAGGVALNCVANARILREGPFRRLFVQPAAGDAGGALGAAALAWMELTGASGAVAPMRHVFLGPRWGPDEIADLLAAVELPAADFRGREEALLDEVAGRLAAGQVVGWFQGAMEFGPRALGARSILASPLDPAMRGRLNHRVKRREGFRPFAPAVLASRAAEHFDLDHPSPFMLETCAVRSPLPLPAVTHVDGSARPQTVDPASAPRLAALLQAFERKTGCPVLLETSFNVAGEPIVRSPADALFTMAEAGLDALVLEDHLLDQTALPEGWTALLAAWRRHPGSASAVSEALYTFV